MKKFAQWCGATALAFLAVNLICVFYFHTPASINRAGGAVYNVNQPGSFFTNTEEGYGFNKVDHNGYVNSEDILSDDGYILFLGNSMTQGSTLKSDQRYVQILNQLLKEDSGSANAKAYSIARGGSDFVELATGYEAAVAEFPQANAVVIQISDGNFNYDRSDEIFHQRFYEDTQSASSLFENEDTTSTLVHNVKNFFPLVAYIKGRRFDKLSNPFSGAFIYQAPTAATPQNTTEDVDKDQLKKLTDILTWLNSRNDLPLIILNIPSIRLEEDGSIFVYATNNALWTQACEASGVQWINMAEDWQELYNSSKILPFGYTNSKIGHGHMSPAANEKVAIKLYNILNSLQEDK